MDTRQHGRSADTSSAINAETFTIDKLVLMLETNSTEKLAESIAFLEYVVFLRSSPAHLNAVSNTPGLSGTSPVYWLAKYPAGQQYLINDDVLRGHISEISLNSVIPNGADKGLSALYWLTTSDNGVQLLARDAALRKKILPEGLNATRQKGINIGTCALFWIVMNPAGRDMFCADTEFRSKALSQGLNAVCLDGVHGGQSALFFLAKSEKGRKLFLDDKSFRIKIDDRGLNAVCQEGADRGTTTLWWLLIDTICREYIYTDPDLLAKIAAENLNAIKQEGRDAGVSTLFLFLLNSPAGLDIIIQNAGFRKKISREGLNSVIQEGVNKGVSALFLILLSNNGIEWFAKDKSLYKKVTPAGLNSVIESGEFRGHSALLLLTRNNSARALLLNDTDLCNLISSESLNAIDKLGNSPLFYLTLNASSLLITHPALTKKITSAGLNTIQHDGYEGSSPLWFLSYYEDGAQLKKYPALMNLITAEGLNTIYINNEIGGVPAAFWLACYNLLSFSNLELLRQVTPQVLNVLKPAGKAEGSSVLLWILHHWTNGSIPAAELKDLFDKADPAAFNTVYKYYCRPGASSPLLILLDKDINVLTIIPSLARLITPEGLNYEPVLRAIVFSPVGCEFLICNPDVCNMITASSVLNNCSYWTRESLVNQLAKSKHGRALLRSSSALSALIDAGVLNANLKNLNERTIPNSSPAYHLLHTPDGIELLKANPMLFSKIDARKFDVKKIMAKNKSSYPRGIFASAGTTPLITPQASQSNLLKST